MGFVRGALVVIVCVLLFVSLLATGLFITVSSSLTYDNVQPKVSSIATEIIQEQIGEVTIVDELTPYLDEYCDTNSEIIQEFEGYTFVFPCDIVAGGTESIISYSVNYLVEDFYYKEYTCEFWSCLEESDIPLFLVSEYAKNYWKGWFFKAFLLSLILAAGLVLLSKRKSRGFVLTGAVVIVASIVVLQFSKIGAFVAKLVLSPISGALSGETSQVVLADIVGIFFSSSNTIFVWMFVIALILIACGILLKLFKVGFKISAFFRRIESQDAEKVKEVKEPQKVKVVEKVKVVKEVKEVKPKKK